MVQLKSFDNGNVQPKPRYGHLSATNPGFAPMRDVVDKDIAQLWELPHDEFLQAWADRPPALLDDSPVIGKDITTELLQIPVRDGTLIEICVYKPISPELNAILNFNTHGGGWYLKTQVLQMVLTCAGFVVGTHSSEEAQNRMIAYTNKTVVVSPAYRMAPKYKFPYAINDSFDALLWCKKNASKLGVNPERIVLSGGSAGANIAAVLAQTALREHVSGIIGQVLNIPVTCHPTFFPHDEFELNSYRQNASGSIVDQPMMMWFWDQYLPQPEPDWRASPLLVEDLRGLPPALVQIAGADPLRDEGFAYADRLVRAGVRTTVKVYPGLPHGFYFFMQLKEAREYLEEVSKFIKSL
ncbi:lipase [Calycina marina]|uniref:Lipase n=1 Tax=Calycina marina TaxID=1763456 RepID=A0A9P8CAV4_9HELO|nr:lipase [Calycina marina]